MAWLMDNWGMIVGVLFALSEALSVIPFFKSNGVFQLIYNTLKGLVGKKEIAP